MRISRTGIKALIGAVIFFSIFLLSMPAAENFYRSSDHVRFGEDMGRPWNHWDILWISSLVISASLVAVSLMFLKKDD